MRPTFDVWRGLLFAFKDTQVTPLRSGVTYAPTWIRDIEWNNPKTFSNHKTTAMTTTAFKMDLIVACIGMKRLTNQSKTPTTIRATTS
jgi:hypothetical protein